MSSEHPSTSALAPSELDRLMDRYAAGDSTAFPVLHRHLAPRLRGFLVRMSGRARVADDLLQETFLRIHRARGTFNSGASVLAWTYAIARNTFIDHSRGKEGKSRASSSLDDLSDDAQPMAPSATSPDADLVGRQVLDVVRATLESLPASQREAFILIRFEGLSVAEAALVLGTTEGNVKVRAFRAYEAFRQALKESEKT